jgi:hypothetical protein
MGGRRIHVGGGRRDTRRGGGGGKGKWAAAAGPEAAKRKGPVRPPHTNGMGT